MIPLPINRFKRIKAHIWAPIWLLVSLLIPRTLSAVDFNINHETGAITPSSFIEAKAGEPISISISNTDPRCFRYQTRRVAVEEEVAKETLAELRTTVMLATVVHDGKDTDFVVSVEKISSDDCKEVSLPDRSKDPFVISVRSFTWKLGFAGGFTVDDLTSPSFALTPSSRTVDGEPKAGFEAIRQSGNEDKYILGAAAMIHLYYSKPASVFNRWAPISFGLGVNNGSEVRYFIGTSLRLGDDFFLTAGGVFGSIDTLPSGLDLHDRNFTTDANALQNVGSKTDSGVFVSLSYRFLGDKGPLEAVFKSPPPASPARTGDSGEPQEEVEED